MLKLDLCFMKNFFAPKQGVIAPNKPRLDFIQQHKLDVFNRPTCVYYRVYYAGNYLGSFRTFHDSAETRQFWGEQLLQRRNDLKYHDKTIFFLSNGGSYYEGIVG